MFFFRRNRYYDDAEIFANIMVFLVVFVLLGVFIFYFALIVLSIFLAIGAVIGGIYAVIGVISVLPQVITDVKAKSYRGGRTAVFFKKFLYFFVSIAKFSIVELIRRAKKILVKFSARRFLSFTKWMYLMLAISIIVFGIAILASVWGFCAALLLAVIFAVLSLFGMLVAALCIVALAMNAVVAAEGLFVCVGKCFIPTCCRFSGKPPLSEIGKIPGRYCRQTGDFARTVWRGCGNVIADLERRAGQHIIIHPYMMFILALKITYYVFVPVVIAAGILLISAAFIVVYLINTIWILIRSMFR